ncbi:MAG: ABC transporter substrate-binding protein [Kiritimatiellae bacterium]|nr:ABC transporter substrate-binding protein [Kiritimatiellia bacterium]
MLNILRQLRLALLLIAGASAILLASDWERRQTAKPAPTEKLPRIALMQFTSTPLLDAHVAGILDGLKQAGLLAPDNANVHLYNPQGDYTTANAAATEMAKGDFDLLITSSTVALQIVAKANQITRRNHVFGGVTFPQGAGVGITGPNKEDHPPWLAGIGTFQPVRRAFEIMHTMNPMIRRVGVVWNPGEQCSEACLNEARAICRERNIELIEANAGNTSEVSDAVRSLLARSVEALWIGGDTVANASAPLIIHLAEQAHVPVFTNDPADAEKGALFGIGANYHTIGRYTADIAAAILRGRSPASYRIENVIPEKFNVNRSVLSGLTGWHMTDDLLTLEQKEGGTKPLAPSPKPKDQTRIALSYYVPAPIFEQALSGFRDRLAEGGYHEGKNLTLIIQHANGEMALLPQVTANLLATQPDVMVPFSTPCLGSAIALGGQQSIVFGVVSAPIEAGAGRDFTNHLPNVTGALQKLPTEELFDRTRALFPTVKRIGVLYNPAEANSVKEVNDLKHIFSTRGFELEEVTVNNTSEVSEGILALLSHKVNMVFLIADNTVVRAMPAIVNACRNQHIPVIADDSSLMGGGAVMSCAPAPYACGAETADLVIRVLEGESPADIPITPVMKNELALDLAAARLLDLTLPPDLLQRADLYYHLSARFNRPAQIALINLVENPSLEQAETGFENGLNQCGLQPGADYVLKKYNAQGDMTILSQLLDAAATDQPDLIATITTPALMAAVGKNLDIPLVFTVASDPARLNLFTNGRPDHICGVHDDPPVGALLEMALLHDPTLQTIGTVYDPSQMNALISVQKLRAVTAAKGMRLIEVTAASVSDLPLAAQSLIQQGAQALLVSADNLITTGFPAVSRAAEAAGVPVFTTEPRLMEQGATGCIGDDYKAWGEQAGRLAAAILAGVPPSSLPIEPTAKTIVIEPDRKPRRAPQQNTE